LCEVRLKEGRERTQLIEGNFGEFPPFLEGLEDDASDDFVSVTELEATADKIVGKVCRVGVIADRGGGGTLPLQLDVLENGRRDEQTGRDGVERIEEGLFVLLEVFIVSEWEAFGQGEECREMTKNTSGLSANEFQRVWVLLLRHEAAAGGDAVPEAKEAKLLCRIEDEVLSETGEVHHRQRGRAGKLDEVVTVTDGVETVVGDPIETKFMGHPFAIDWVVGTGEGTGPERELVDAATDFVESLGIAREHLEIGQQVVGKEDRLGLLEVGVARDGGIWIAISQVEQGEAGFSEASRELIDLLAQKEAGSDGDLVIAASSGVEFIASHPDPLDESGLDEAVDILCPGKGRLIKISGVTGGFSDPSQSLRDRGHLFGGEDSRPSKGTSVDSTRLKVCPKQTSVEPETGIIRRKKLIDLARKAPTPQTHPRILSPDLFIPDPFPGRIIADHPLTMTVGDGPAQAKQRGNIAKEKAKGKGERTSSGE
jgi:hypothetical protein